MNIAININHNPLVKSPLLIIKTTPAIIIAMANTCPALPAMRAANRRFLVNPQTTDCKTLPPSSGNPGNMLNTASAMFCSPM